MPGAKFLKKEHANRNLWTEETDTRKDDTDSKLIRGQLQLISLIKVTYKCATTDSPHVKLTMTFDL